jgi:hypothetical protein
MGLAADARVLTIWVGTLICISLVNLIFLAEARYVFHQNAAGLMENRDALLVIAGALLLVTLAIARKT